jgi:hypothetical protein
MCMLISSISRIEICQFDGCLANNGHGLIYEISKFETRICWSSFSIYQFVGRECMAQLTWQKVGEQYL